MSTDSTPSLHSQVTNRVGELTATLLTAKPPEREMIERALREAAALTSADPRALDRWLRTYAPAPPAVDLRSTEEFIIRSTD